MLQGLTKGFEEHVGSRVQLRVLNKAESRIYAHGGRRGTVFEALAVVT